MQYKIYDIAGGLSIGKLKPNVQCLGRGNKTDVFIVLGVVPPPSIVLVGVVPPLFIVLVGGATAVYRFDSCEV